MYRHLGTVATQAEGDVGALTSTTVGVTAAATSSGLIAASAATSWIPIVGGVIAALATIAELFHVGQGCGNACIESAQTEQIFEAAADNVYYACKAGMLSGPQGVAAIQWLQEQGDSQMAQLEQTDKSASGGKTNMDKTLAAEISSVQSAFGSNPATVPLNPTTLQSSIFIQPGTTGWYAQSIAAASSLALQAIAEATNITSNATAAAASTAGPAAVQSSLAPSSPGAQVVAPASSIPSELTSIIPASDLASLLPASVISALPASESGIISDLTSPVGLILIGVVLFFLMRSGGKD
jgi:hypothetical protein